MVLSTFRAVNLLPRPFCLAQDENERVPSAARRTAPYIYRFFSFGCAPIDKPLRNVVFSDRQLWQAGAAARCLSPLAAASVRAFGPTAEVLAEVIIVALGKGTIGVCTDDEAVVSVGLLF